MYAFSFPQRLHLDGARLDLFKTQDLQFFKPDYKKFKCLQLASEALQRFTKQPELWNKPQFCDFLTVYAALAAVLANGYKIAFDIDTGA